MHFHILTIFPELFERYFEIGLFGRGLKDGTFTASCTQLRDFAINTHGQIDDTPYGGGSGMVLRPEPAVAAIEHAKKLHPNARVVLFTPRGQPLKQQQLREYATKEQDLILLCTRYEGVDERVTQWVDDEISLGDFVLMGGEVPAMGLLEGVARLLPGVLGNASSVCEESFSTASTLEYPHFTKPREFRNLNVPEILLSGNHAEIQRWRAEQSTVETIRRRPDLLRREVPLQAEVNIALVHHPVMGKEGEIITSSITNIDVHDLARSAHTFGCTRFYITHPTKTLRRLTEKIQQHWLEGFGATYNPNRKEALELVCVLDSVDEAIADIERRTGQLPFFVVTSAQEGSNTIPPDTLRAIMSQSNRPVLVVFGTGWGLAPEILARADARLCPILGASDYNHLSVRAATAIILDRLFSRNR